MELNFVGSFSFHFGARGALPHPWLVFYTFKQHKEDKRKHYPAEPLTTDSQSKSYNTQFRTIFEQDRREKVRWKSEKKTQKNEANSRERKAQSTCVWVSQTKGQTSWKSFKVMIFQAKQNLKKNK